MERECDAPVLRRVGTWLADAPRSSSDEVSRNHVQLSSSHGFLVCDRLLYPYSVYTYNCYREGTASPDEDSWKRLVKETLVFLGISHCPELTVPNALQSLPNLLGLQIHNTTIVEWTKENGISASKHTKMIVLVIVRTNMSRLPEGMLGPLPARLVDIELSHTSLTPLPLDLHKKWHSMATVYFEHSLMTEFPQTLLSLQAIEFSLHNNLIERVPRIPADLSFLSFTMSANPLAELLTKSAQARCSLPSAPNTPWSRRFLPGQRSKPVRFKGRCSSTARRIAKASSTLEKWRASRETTESAALRGRPAFPTVIMIRCPFLDAPPTVPHVRNQHVSINQPASQSSIRHQGDQSQRMAPIAWRATFISGVVTTMLVTTATVAILPIDDSVYPECQPGVLRPFTSEKNGRDCARDAGFRSAFDLIRAPPSDTQLLAICKSRACDTLFNEQLPAQEPGRECTVPVGDKIRMYADLVSHVRKCCTNMKDTYVLLNCDVLGTNGGERSEFWYFPDSTNISFVPEKANRYTISGDTKAVWEGDEVSVTRTGWEIFAYIDDTGYSEPDGHHAGILEAGRGGGLNTAYECSRADDWAYPQSGESRCQRRYICYSE